MKGFKAISSDDKSMEDLSITIDKQGRLCLNAGMRRELEAEDNKVSLYLFFDQRGRRIGLSKKSDDRNVQPFNFDNRGYCSRAKSFLLRNEFDYKSGAIQLIFDEHIDGGYAFREKGSNYTLRQEKNGNLERVEGR